MNNRNNDGQLTRSSNFKSVPILFEKQKNCICSKEKNLGANLFNDSSSENLRENQQTTSLNQQHQYHQHRPQNVSNTIGLENQSQTQYRVGDSSSILQHPNETKEV